MCDCQDCGAKNNHRMTTRDTAPIKAMIDATCTPSVDEYLAESQRNAAVERLPDFEWQTGNDITLLKRNVEQLYRLLGLSLIILMVLLALGGLLWLS